jgi:phage terminase large subunit-like protein
MAKSFKEQLALMSPEERERTLDLASNQEILDMANDEWWFTQRPEQVPPDGPWTIHLYLGGRGTGKTKAGAEWLVQRSLDFPYTASGHPADRLVMAYNVSDCQVTCIEGSSGILAILRRKGLEQDRDFTYTKAPKPRITFLATGAKIHFTGATKPDVVRGLNLADAWLDEIVKWQDPFQIWKEGIHHALRSDIPGDKPRVFVTTTPKPIDILRAWTKRSDGFVSMSRGSTFDNAANLNSEFLTEIKLEYAGTLIGRQEIYGELLDDMEGPLFKQSDISDNRVEVLPEDIVHRVCGVDPCLTGGEGGDLMGCVVAARDSKDQYYVVADESVRLTGRDAALHVWRTFARHQCDVLAVETNLGKQWLTEILQSTYRELVDTGLFPKYTTPPIKEIHSNHGKKLRAEPVSIRYQQKKVHHVGAFEHLEAQMVGWDPISAKVSPDRLDALVHAVRHLMEGERRTVRFFSPNSVTVRGL